MFRGRQFFTSTLSRQLRASKTKQHLSLYSTTSKRANAPFIYQSVFDLGKDTTTPYKKLTSDYVSVVKGPDGKEFLKIDPEALRLLSSKAMIDIAHLLRPSHLQSLSNIVQHVSLPSTNLQK